MAAPVRARRVQLDRSLLCLALTIGLSLGLVEGVVHLALQRLGLLDNTWYPIIWIAAAFNGLATGLLGLILVPLLSLFVSQRRARSVAAFALFLAGCLPPLVLLLKAWLSPYAIVLLVVGAASALARWFDRDQEARLRLCRRALPGVAGLTLAAFVTIEGGIRVAETVQTSRLPRAAASAPDVLVVIVDTLRADHLACYGYPRQTSPALDRLASEGVVFENAFSTSSYTLPSHESILTGLYPRHHGVEWDTSYRSRRSPHVTLPEAMQGLGYRTGAFSGNTFYFTREHGFGRGFLHFEDFFHSVADMFWRTAWGGVVDKLVRRRLGFNDLPARKRADDTNRAVLDWTGRDVDRPFFVVINYMDVHDPYLPPQPYRGRFSSVAEPGGVLDDRLPVPEKLTGPQLQGEIDAYDGAITYVDDRLERLLAALKARRSRRDLLVVVTSDHGEEFGEHGGFLHGGTLYREVIHVPLIIWRPGSVPGGVRVRQPVTNAAIPATILTMLGASDLPPGAPPLSLLWTADSPRAADWPPPLAELKHRPWEPEREPVHFGALRSLVDARWHYIEQDHRGTELYDWVADTRETNNLANAPELQPVVDRFRALIR